MARDDDAGAAAWHLDAVDRSVSAREIRQTLDEVVSIHVEQVADEQMARWTGDRLGGHDGIHFINPLCFFAASSKLKRTSLR